MASPSLLSKCEDFLLHPTVRVLSLAQRVDFLEKKGLSPEQITQCLKSVEQRNGLSQLTRRSAKQLADVQLPISASKAASSPLMLLKHVVKKYGVVTLLLALLGLGYVQYRTSKTQQLAIASETHKLQRKKRMSDKVEKLLDVVKHQQMQYNQAAELLNARVDRYLAVSQVKKDSTAKFTRGLELQTLQKELLELKSVVVDTYLRPTVVEKVVEVTRELPIVLRPAEASVSDRLKQGTELVVQRMESTVVAATPHEKKWRQEPMKQKEEEDVEERSAVRDQTTMTPAEITELFQSGQFDEELSTARSYRILFATQ